MGYESAIPPLPTRSEELAMISKYERDFLSQPNYKWYMNEALRKTKLDYSERLNRGKKAFLMNFSIGLVLAGPLVIYGGRFFHRVSSGVPFFFRPKYYMVNLNVYNQARNMKAFTYQVPLWISLGLAYAYRYTDRSQIDDENFDNYKIHKML